jgi:hypothetical protein
LHLSAIPEFSFFGYCGHHNIPFPVFLWTTLAQIVEIAHVVVVVTLCQKHQVLLRLPSLLLLKVVKKVVTLDYKSPTIVSKEVLSTMGLF